MKRHDDFEQSRREFLKYAGAAAGTASLVSLVKEGRAATGAESGAGNVPTTGASAPAAVVQAIRVAADPAKIPPPIKRRRAADVPVLLEAQEVTAEIEPGVTFQFMTYNGQVPGPFIRVREGDTIHLTFRNRKDSTQPHNVDFHAVMGPGGGAMATMTDPGEEADLDFKATYPGAFIYHCAVSNMDMHISAGMFGLILVEPKEGLRRVDHEFYLGQHEIYTDKPAGLRGHHGFDNGAMVHEQPTYVVFNGAKNALTSDRYGPMNVKTGETVRVYLVVGGPNLISSFHPIGNVWHDLWPEGAVRTSPLHYIQTYPVPPGSTAITTLQFPVPGDVKLVDHALSRVVHQGCLAVIHADGAQDPAIFKPGARRKL
jgi:nitrite reductase (NO-forming)